MTGSELLVQRFVDQELSAEERVQLLVRLGHDEELRRRAVALERLSLEASQLPRPIVPDGFVAAVLKQTPPTGYLHVGASASDGAARPSLWQRTLSSLWTPHVFQWNFAGAAAAACILLLAIGGIVAGMRPSSPAPAPSIATTAPAAERVLVRLVVVHPGARTVQAAGDFNGWNPAQTPLEPVSNGAWTVTIPLEPGRYEYQFVVDGEEWIADPFAVEQNDDGFGSRNAVLDVRPAGAAL